MLSILIVLLLLVVLPEGIRLVPLWVPSMLGFAVLAPSTAAGLTAAKQWWLAVERTVILAEVVVVGVGTLTIVVGLVDAIISSSAHDNGLQLLTLSIAAWVTNVLLFSLLYWRIDCGGPQPLAVHAKSYRCRHVEHLYETGGI